jgi:8-amino-7-oxononanoate synthase
VSVLDFLEDEIEALRARGLYRTPDDGGSRHAAMVAALALGVDFIDASSNDYLGLAQLPPDVSRETISSLSTPQASSGAGASRLIHGTRAQHTDLECCLAAWVGFERALLFASGYAANVGALSGLVQPQDIVISDALNHASIIDGCRLARAQIRIAPHRDAAAIESLLRTHAADTRCWVVTESYFSMDGDSPDLQLLRALCDRYGAALIVDEAHALGVFGGEGSGLCSTQHVRPDVLVGTFGKAIGAQGAFVASSRTVRDWLWNRARSFVYSTAVSPLLAAAIHRNLQTVRNDNAARKRLAVGAEWFRNRLAEASVATIHDSFGPIVPVLFPSAAHAMAATERLGRAGILTQAIRPPTVPENSARIRLTLHAGLTQQQLERLAYAVIDTCAH